MDKEQVLDTVEKLLNLAGGTSFEAEASAAMSKAHELLLKHGLEMADLAARGNGHGQEDVRHQAYEVPDDCWRQAYSVLARHNFCRIVLDYNYDKQGGRGSYRSYNSCHIVGRPTNIKAVATMAAKVMVQLEAMAWVDLQMNPDVKRGVRAKRAFRVSYILGALKRLDDRLSEENSKVEENVRGSTALVVSYDAENRGYMRRQWPHLISARGIAIRDNGAWSQGYARGNDLNLHVELSSGRRALGRG